MDEVGYVEIKPGIPPDPAHLVQLIKVMRNQKASMLLMEDFYNKTTASLVAEKAGAKLLVLPTDVGARPEIKDWFTLVETALKQMAEAR